MLNKVSAQLPTPFNLTGRVAIVTGSTRGIGLAIVEAFCRAGAKCVVSSECSDDVKDTSQKLAATGFDVLSVTCDVTQEGDHTKLVEATLSHYGHLDIVVCNAGITGSPGPITETDSEDYLRVFDINLHSMVALCKTAFPALNDRQSASIVLMSSIAGLRGNQSINAYALTKAGVAQLARNLAVQWGPNNIRVNSISPGLIRTAISDPLIADKDYIERRLQMTPLRRVGQAKDVAGCALFLASDAANFVTGHNLVVDGGTTITDGS